MMSLISVIVPVYGVEPFIDKCVLSIVEQSYKKLDIILVVDGACDNSPEKCMFWAGQDSRIRVINKENGGLSDARNAGLDVAKGDYIMFVDSDDYIDSEMVSKLFNRMKEDQSDLALCDIQLVDEDYKLLESNNCELENKLIDEHAFWRSRLGVRGCVVWNKLYSKYIFVDLRFEKGEIHEDDLILHHIISKCRKISVLDECLYFYYQRANSIIRSNFQFKRINKIKAYYHRTRYFMSISSYDIIPDYIVDMMISLSRFRRRLVMTAAERQEFRDLKFRIILLSCRYMLLKRSCRLWRVTWKFLFSEAKLS